ncbi:GNAT family N-acetyltransferase [Acinetobacter sp. LoGeW2-3]|uniref:GNAT family N-acetyltransferase n=1 Tax=Acinetobacter sp. LoGeW2-3 TaxID=1808001 RepID=UPI000C05CBCD|nr:GNAT family N-acetyltransferase [Acinetobacter sp. LoGeW2-3]ATO19137.1 GNAT family N-acetyltransferase [Acinetobacter sp. LoGeW2-3]
MQIEHQEQGSKGEWYVAQEDKRLAEMTYSRAGDDKFIIDHTWVDDSLRGQRVGQQLVEAAVNFARTQGLKIIPLCPFAKSVFDRNESIRDVLQ